ncbi:Large ribosomal subunit protein uL24c-like protein [Drosera capensis]
MAAAMAGLQSSFSYLSLSSTPSFFRHRTSPSLSYPPLVKQTGRSSCLIVAMVRRWEIKKFKTANGQPLVNKMHVKLGDTVKVISGRDRGRVGEVTKIFKHNSTIIVTDVNIKTKHMKKKPDAESGEILKIYAPIHSSNVMLYSKERDATSRVGHKVLEDGTKVRYLIKTGEIIDSADKWKEVVKNKEKTSGFVIVDAS